MNKLYKYKTVLSKLLLAGVFAGSLYLAPQPVQAVEIKDINLSASYARDSILALAQKNIISGDENGYFHPLGVITRAEMVKIIVSAMGINTANIPSKPSFTDVPKTHWAYKYVEAAKREGIVAGLPDGSFGVSQKLTREQMATMFVRSTGLSNEILTKSQQPVNVSQLSDKNKVGAWAQASVDFALATGIMKGTDASNFTPGGFAEKQQVATVADRFLQNETNIMKLSEAIQAMAENQIRMVVNGEEVYLDNKPVLANSQVLVPAKLFKELGASVTEDSSKGTVLIERGGTSKVSIWFKAESGFAYVNYTGGVNPFDNGTGLDSYRVALGSPAKAANGDILVPAVFAAGILKVEAVYDQTGSTIKLTDRSMTQYSNLHSAMTGNLNYKGDFSLKMGLMLKEKVSNQTMSQTIDMNGSANGQDMKATVKVGNRIPFRPYSEITYDLVKVGGKTYVKLSSQSPWVETSLYEMHQIGLIDMNFDQTDENNALLLGDYGNLNIQRVGSAVLDNQLVTKYTITLSSEMIEALANNGDLYQFSETGEPVNMATMFNKGFSFTVDYYVNEQKQLVKETYRFNGSTLNSDSDVDSSIVIDTVYRNIGTVVPITAPLVQTTGN